MRTGFLGKRQGLGPNIWVQIATLWLRGLISVLSFACVSDYTTSVPPSNAHGQDELMKCTYGAWQVQVLSKCGYCHYDHFAFI